MTIAGCAPSAESHTGEPPNPDPGSTFSPAPVEDGTPDTEPDDDAVPLSIPCASLISAQQMYDFNPNFALLDSFEPGAGSLPALAVEQGGTVCRWVHETSGTAIDVSIAHPSATERGALVAAARSGMPMNGIGDEAYFSSVDGIGTAQAFTGGYWVLVSSEFFVTPSDPLDLLNAVVDSLT